MGIFDFLRSETKESRTGAILVQTPGQPVWTPKNYKSFAREGYSQNVIAYQSINRIAEAVASIEWTAWRGDVELSESPLLDLIRKPNPLQSGYDFMIAKIGYLMISGNSYDERVMVGGSPRELYTHRPDRMKVIPSKSGIPAGYIYKTDTGQIQFDFDAIKMTGDLRHMKLFNPVNDWYGQSPIEAGAYGVDQHNESMQWIQALLQNSARPSGALQTAPDKDLSEEQFNRLKTQMETQYAGAGNAGRPMLLEGGLTWQQMGLSPSDMAVLETKYSAARDVSLAFGVPPQLLGIPGDNTYSNYAEARLSFYEDTVIPLVTRVAMDWTNWLGPAFGDVELRPDLDAIPAIAEKRNALWMMADASLDLTINERRHLKGFEPVNGGDVLMVEASKIPLGDAGLSLDDLTDDDDDEIEDQTLISKAIARMVGYASKAD